MQFFNKKMLKMKFLVLKNQKSKKNENPQKILYNSCHKSMEPLYCYGVSLKKGAFFEVCKKHYFNLLALLILKIIFVSHFFVVVEN